MEAPLKILMLEDMPEDAGLVERVLRKSNLLFESKRVDTREEFINAIKEYSPDIILSDHSLPQFNSTEAIRICRHHKLNIPFILVTGTVSEEFAVNVLKEGADDYILKGNMTRLPLAIKNALKQKKAENERRKAEQSLREQNSELIKINKELDRFVYSTSHDLRAPLKSVLGLLNLAEDDDKSKMYESMAVYHHLMRKTVFKLDETINGILDYSRNTRYELLNEEIKLQEIIEEVWQSLQYMEGASRIGLRVNITGNVPLFTDPKRIKIIFNNIFSNSIKYQDTGKEKSYLFINANISDKTAFLLIEDNGIGIGEKYLQKIFDMFFKASEKSDGSGLGLYIVKEALEKIGGSISAKSTPGKETSFTIEFPNSGALQGDQGDL